MSKKHESAELILRLYELRREPVMRDARNWFFMFNPSSAQDILAAVMGENSAYFRMVTSYWDMACSFVNHGAISEDMFNDANGEHLAIFTKLHPYLEEMRKTAGNPDYLKHLEKVVLGMPDAETRMARMRERMMQLAAARGQTQQNPSQNT
jgi:hypothetical protein